MQSDFEIFPNYLIIIFRSLQPSTAFGIFQRLKFSSHTEQQLYLINAAFLR